MKRFIAYQTLWDSTETPEEKILALLEDYCKGTRFYSPLSVFAHGHFNRHHTDTVRSLIIDYRGSDKNLTVDNILHKLKELPKNENSSLSRRLQFIKDRYTPGATNETHEDVLSQSCQ